MPQPYLSLEAAWHDAFWDSEDDQSELPLIRHFLAQHPGQALEIGCGSGRLMLPLLQEGYAIEGLELSPDMIGLAHARAKEEGLTPQIHMGDMETWQPPTAPYNALLAPAFTLQLATHPNWALQRWHDWLAPNGGLYLTVFLPLAELFGELPEHTWYPDHQATLDSQRTATIHTRHQIDRSQQILHREHRYAIEGDASASYTSHQQIRWIEHEEMHSLLTKAGFQVERCVLDFDPKFPATTPLPEEFDGILTYVARKLDHVP